MWGEKKHRDAARTDPDGEACVVEASFVSDTGPRRSSNEDSAAVVVPRDAARLASRGTLVLVADGMGGHEGGEVASEMAARLVSENYYADENADPQTALVNAFQSANRAIFERAKKEPELTGMGTTCTAVAIVDGLAFSAHVGDSRTYLVRGNQLYRMTEDHSAIMEMVKQGLIGMSEAREHEDRNVILRAMGTHKDLEVAVWDTPFALRPEDRLVLCSDGLHDMVTDAEICAIASANDHRQACAELLQLALDRISSDNVTVAVVQVFSHK
jgi:PPM family protein phosphatase